MALAAASIAALSEQMWHLMHPGLEAKDSPELLEEWPVGCYGCFRTNGLLPLDRFSSAARRSIQNERCFAFGGREHQGSVARENIHHLKPRLCLSCTQFTDQYSKWKAARRCIECNAIMTAGETMPWRPDLFATSSTGRTWCLPRTTSPWRSVKDGACLTVPASIGSRPHAATTCVEDESW